MKNVVYDFGNYEKHNYDEHIMIFVPASILSYESFVRSYEQIIRDKEKV